MAGMTECEKRSYAAEITNNQSCRKVSMDAIIYNVDRETAEKIIFEMEAAKEKISRIMAG